MIHLHKIPVHILADNLQPPFSCVELVGHLFHSALEAALGMVDILEQRVATFIQGLPRRV